MEPFKSDGNSIDRSVLSRMRRLDRQLRATWSIYSIDLLTGQPIEQTRRMDVETGIVRHGPVLDPAFYLWRKDPYSSHHFYVAQYPRFTHKEVLGLEGDVARFTSPNHLGRILRERMEERRVAALRAARSHNADKAEANEHRIRTLLDRSDSGYRDARTFSYSGQGSRRTGAEGAAILKDRNQDGWE